LLKKGVTLGNISKVSSKPVVNEKFRKEFVEGFGSEGIWSDTNNEGFSPIDIIKRMHKEAYDKELLEKYEFHPMYMKTVELASKILICFNGELSMAFNVRIDLILIGVIKDFKGELEILRLSLKKFRKSYIGWFYRRLVFSVNWALHSHKFEEKYLKNEDFGSKDFSKLKSIWENEYEVVVEASQQKTRSYKLWEHLCLTQLKISNYLISLLNNEKAEEGAKTELEIFLIETISGFYDKAKVLCAKDIHNNCLFEYLNCVLRIMFRLKIDEFMGEEEFYKQFIEDHLAWVVGLDKYHEKLLEFDKKERQKWVALTMIDYSKLVSLKAHRRVVENWDEYLEFYKGI